VRHNLRPLFDRVVVKELEPDRIRQSGLLVPPGSHEPPPQHGIVLAVGPGLDSWVEVDEERLLVCRVGELLGVLETEAEAKAA
jgi:chaperonin GroES